MARDDSTADNDPASDESTPSDKVERSARPTQARLPRRQSNASLPWDSPAFEAFRKQQADIAKLFNAPAFDAFRRQQADIAKLFNASAFDAFRRQQADIAKLFNASAFDAFSKQQADIAKLFKAPGLDAFRKQQAEFGRIVASPAFDLLHDQQLKIARLAESSLRGSELQQVTLRSITAATSLFASVATLELASTRVVSQIARLASMPNLRLGPQVGQAARSWAVATRRPALEASIIDPRPTLELARTVEAVNATAFELNRDQLALADETDEPWIAGRTDETLRLVDWLTQVNPKLALKYKGAWRLVSQPGPDWISQAANSAVELIDWTLRELAPDKAVTEWRAGKNMYADEMSPEGRPYRSLRVRYIAATRNLPSSSVDLIVKSVIGTMKDLQKMKHATDESMAAALKSALIAVEFCLVLLRGE